MFEKTRRLAEQVATSVSRRGFLGSPGGLSCATAFRKWAYARSWLATALEWAR
jgi:hypothetical protein